MEGTVEDSSGSASSQGGHSGKTAGQVQDNFLVVPGEQVGKTHLGITASLLNSLLGKPDMSDAAMGKAWLTWYGKRDEHNNRTRLDIYVTYKDSSMSEKVVKQIRTTSSSFHTAGNLHVYSSMVDIRQRFPGLEKAGHYNTDGRDILIYDDKSKGIAFEQVAAGNEDICTAIIIHERNVPVTQTYIYLRSLQH